MEGSGVPKDAEKALALNIAACKQKNKFACMNAGRTLAEGADVPKDETRGYELLDRACAMDHAFSCTLVGRHLVATNGDRARARTLLQKACSLKDQSGCAALEQLDASK